MKTGALILSFLFIVLSVQPVFINWNRMPCITAAAVTAGNIVVKRSSCCKKVYSAAKKTPLQKPVKQQSENPCDNCNPFMPCNACPYMAGESQEFVSPVILNAGENTDGLNDLTLSDYNAECWHPPELFSHL